MVGVSEEGEGLLVNWEEVGGVVNMYKVGVARLDRGNTVVLFTMAPPLRVLSEKVGGYERVNVSVAAVNMAGFGPYSEPQFARTPSIREPHSHTHPHTLPHTLTTSHPHTYTLSSRASWGTGCERGSESSMGHS